MAGKLSGGGYGFLEYALIVILIFLILFTVISLLWPAIVMFYENTLVNFIN
jgi:Flp pilus assembly pilin Flp